MGKDQAQHLITVSMTKIQSARSKRSGLNLHKSLLVSTVLFKAKTALIMAKYNMRCEYDDPVVEELIDDGEEEGTCEELDNHENEQRIVDQGHSDEQVVPDACVDSSAQDTLPENSCLIEDSQEEDKENCVPVAKVCDSLEQSLEAGKTKVLSCELKDSNSKCTKCSKRRLTEVDIAVESIIKRHCSEQDNCLRGVENTQLHNHSHESMDCSPITSLVASFSCGFSGLLCDSQSYSSSDKDNAFQRGLSDSYNNISCSTQIKESFETLSSSASCIMLSV